MSALVSILHCMVHFYRLNGTIPHTCLDFIDLVHLIFEM